MKKLMIVLAAVALGFASQASVVDWKYGITGASKTDTTYDSATAYLISASAWSTLTAAEGGVTEAALQGAALDSSALTGKTTTKKNWYTSNESGTLNYTRAVDVGSSIDAGSSYAAKIIVANNGQYMVVDAALTTRDSSGSTAGTTAFSTTSAAASSATWTSFGGGGTDPSPEPTSGLLMLMGAGLLGLRRKRK